MHKLSRRDFLRGALVLSGLALVDQASSPAVAEGVPVHLAWVSSAVGLMVWPVAQEAGYFRKYGLNESLTFVGGGPIASAALTGGDVDAVNMAGSALVSAGVAGHDLVMVAGFVRASLFRLMAVPQVKRIEDLKGKTVAIAKLGDGTDIAWNAMREYLGWSPGDVGTVQAGSQAGQLAMLQQGLAQAAPFSFPNNVLAEEMIGAHLIFDAATMRHAEQGPGVVVTRKYLRENRKTVLAVLKASIEGMARWKKDPAFVKTVLKRYLKVKSERYLDAAATGYATIWREVPYPSRDGLLVNIGYVSLRNPAAKTARPEQFMDLTLVKELEDSGFIKQIWGR
jgi:ABC-type nitrate/sulfonate/bicarbonate transport system substrate-binding protein